MLLFIIMKKKKTKRKSSFTLKRWRKLSDELFALRRSMDVSDKKIKEKRPFKVVNKSQYKKLSDLLFDFTNKPNYEINLTSFSKEQDRYRICADLHTDKYIISLDFISNSLSKIILPQTTAGFISLIQPSDVHVSEITLSGEYKNFCLNIMTTSNYKNFILDYLMKLNFTEAMESK